MTLPIDYVERVYAGVLGKMIGVYLGRPFEGWTYDRIMRELGEITGYVNHKLPDNPPLVVTDDDISGTFTFLRALPDYDHSRDLTPAQIGQTWLNYIVENQTILWWGGLGNSTEHTAYLRLKAGIPAPQSGSAALNGRLIAEQIGAQIFCDGWAMVAPGDPALAADLAARAARVSHDGEAVYGARLIAALEALAFGESDLDKLLDSALPFIPPDSTIRRLVDDVREWHAAEPDWHRARARLAAVYNYDNYGGNCHIVPNHALIILGLLYGQDDFTEAMKVVNTAGWDTDCNAGNLGCLLGIKNGLAAFAKGPDWRGPVADRLFLAAADSGRAISDAVNETYHIVNSGRALQGLSPLAPKGGARFHFDLPGSVQGFVAEGNAQLANVAGHSRDGRRALALRCSGPAAAVTPTFILPEELEMPGYALVASPTLYPGQTMRALLSADGAARVRPFIRPYTAAGTLAQLDGPAFDLSPAQFRTISWPIPDTGGQPIAQIGLAYAGDTAVTLYLDSLTWNGAPQVSFHRPAGCAPAYTADQPWQRAWVRGIDQWDSWWPQSFRLSQNHGRGLLIQGTREWTDYAIAADVASPLMAAGGIAIRVQGLRRYYALLLCADGKARLLKALDGDQVVAETEFSWQYNHPYHLCLQATGNRLQGWVDGALLFDWVDEERPLTGGGAAFVLAEGHLISENLKIQPAD